MAFIALTQRQPRTPRLRLADAAAATYAEQQQERRAAKAKRPLNRVLRFISMGFAVLFLAVALAGGTGAQKAQAGWWWDDAKNVAAGVLNWCQPESVPVPASRLGLDTELFGLGKSKEGVVPQVKADKASAANIDAATKQTDGLKALQEMFGDGKHVTTISQDGYTSYGISTLKWTKYGAGCMSDGFALTGVSNLLLLFLVTLPATLAMALVSFALNNVLYSGFAAMVQPMVSAMSNIVQPWMWVLVLAVGLPMVWLKSKGSISRLLSATAWVALIGSLFVYLNYNTSSVVSFANNAVSNLSSFAACTFLQNPNLSSSSALLNAGNGQNNGTPGTIKGSGGCTKDIVGNVVRGSSTTFNMADSGIAQQIWYDIPYRVWSMGEVGPDQATKDRALEKAGSVSWSAAILNGMYANPNSDRDILAAVSKWNAGSYGPADKESSKPAYWTDPNGADNWKRSDGTHLAQPAVEVPFLATVKAMCADTNPSSAPDGSFSGDGEKNNWMYSGNCDTATAGTASMVENVTGNVFEQRASAAFSGGISMWIILIVIGFVAMYLSFQKIAFFFLWMFAPLLLAIGAFPDEKRSQFAKKFGEQVFANIIKQVVAVIALLFVVSSIGSILGNSAVPYMMKPMSILAFWIALLVFAVPFTKVLRAAAKGDASIVQKIADAPAKTLKTAAVVTAVAATAAVAAPALIGAAGGLGSMGGMTGLLKAAPKALGPTLQGLGRMTGGHKGMAFRKAGSMLGFLGNTVKGAKGQHLQDQLGIDMLDNADRKRMNLLDKQGNPTDPATQKASRFERVNGTGALTPAGRKAALDEWRTTMKSADSIQDQEKQSIAAKDTFFRTYMQTHGGVRHPLDPQFKDEADKLGDASDKLKETAETLNSKSEQAAADGAASYDARPSYAKGSNVTADAENVTQQRFSGDPAGAFMRDREAFSGKYAPAVEYDLRGEAAMDITHPAMPKMMKLNAGIADGSIGSIEARDLMASIDADLATHGAPAQISHYGLADETIANFDSTNLRNLAVAIPTITAESIDGDARFESAARIAAVAANMPNDHSLRNEVSSAMNTVWSGNGSEAVEAINRLSESVHSYIAVNGGSAPMAESVNFAAPERVGVAAAAAAGAAAGGGFFASEPGNAGHERAPIPAPMPPAPEGHAWWMPVTPSAEASAGSADNDRLAASVDRLNETTRHQSQATSHLADVTRDAHGATERAAHAARQQSGASDALAGSTRGLAEATQAQKPLLERASRNTQDSVAATSNQSEDLPPEAINHKFSPKRRKRGKSVFEDGEGDA